MDVNWATYFGGSNNEEVWDATFGTGGEVFVSGWTNSSDFPDSNSSINYEGGTGSNLTPFNSGNSDAFTSKFRSDLSLEKSQFFGGTSNEEAFSVDRDTNNNVYIFGTTGSETGFPTPTPSGYYSDDNHESHDNTGDAFIAGFDEDLEINWGAYIHGGESQDYSEDYGFGLHVSPLNELYVCGRTTSWGGFFPTEDSGGVYFDGTNPSGVRTGFIARFGLNIDFNPTSIEDPVSDDPSRYYELRGGQGRNNFLVESLTEKEMFCTLLDIRGRKLRSEFVAPFQKEEWDLSNEPSGVYFLRIKVEGETYVEKVGKR